MDGSAVVHVVDDDDAVRDSLAFLLESSDFTVRTYASAADFLAVAGTFRTGCVLTDVRMPGMDGLTLQKQLVARGCRLPVIVMTGHGDVPIAVQALKNGASDFLEKPFDDAALLAAVRGAMAESLRAEEAAAGAAELTERLAALTPREREVLERLVAGQANKTIAFDLGTSPRTVEVQRARVMEKMGARSLAELVRMSLVLEGVARPPR
ncbi:MAG: DNA-binding response regulator [Rhodospirillales bacterium 69-11]|nr:response regulator transcription factor [Rhodospirillales bacterium]MBN8905183.1 response regulator transcription factor [Rhodospirillales bacterium]MBN8925651.1 response regulator transcription factor [Rhodospirillales bacterium]OJW31262.1 MAG: DNA-binding response regulator [Rhodospirillales bacterium 69-11]